MPIDHNKIKRIRVKLGLTQEQAAERSGLEGRQRWWEIESGHVENVVDDKLARIAKALKTTMDDLYILKK